MRHSRRRWIAGVSAGAIAAGAPQMLMGAPVINHTDDELIMLEGLVGRRPPFFSYYPAERNLNGY